MELLLEDIKFLSKDECKEPFIRLNSVGNTNDAGRGVSNQGRIGPMMDTLFKYSDKIHNQEEFYNFWITNIIPDLIRNNPKYSKSEEYIFDLVKEFKNRCNTKGIDEHDLYKYFLFLAIHSTFFGKEVEDSFAEAANSSGKYIVIHSNAYEDANLGIDLIHLDPVTKKPLFLTQVKPDTFISNNTNTGVIPTRKNYFFEISKAEKQYGVPVYFIFYKKTSKNYDPKEIEWYVNYNAKDKNYPNIHCFTLKELCRPNGYMIGANALWNKEKAHHYSQKELLL